MMKLYDEVIWHIFELLERYEAVSLPVYSGTEPFWHDAGKNNMVLRSQMAYELGGGQFPAVGCTAVTANEEFVAHDEILLYGRELSEIRQDVPYARIAVARVSEDSLGQGNALYNAIKKIEYTRYHVNPEGFMMRISSINKRETVRVDREALGRGLDFGKAGNLMLRSFHENPKIEAVKLIFINLEDFPYGELEKAREQADQITDAIDHMMKHVIMDCDVCSLQKVCDEVEGLRELHFG